MLIFCCDPLNPRQPDPGFGREVAAAECLGLEFSLIDFESLAAADADQATRRVPTQSTNRLGIYRGWMLKPKQYHSLYVELKAKGIQLISDPTAYRHCHYLPDSYSKIEAHTPRSVWMTIGGQPSLHQIMALLKRFGDRPIIIKDFVKSRKHEWNEACFIPSANDPTAVERVVARFIELQEDDLNEGLVFREFVEFEPLAQHSKSGMPLIKEFRLFFLDGEPIFSTEYWGQGDYQGIAPPVERFAAIGRTIESRFFTMDVGKRKDGEWMIVELGDGQVAGLPDNADAMQFYSALAGHWPEH